MTDYYEKAHEHRDRGQFGVAADNYTQLAYQRLPDGAITGGAIGTASGGLEALLFAGFCYQISGTGRRATNRCEQGILIAEDLKQYVVSDSKEKAVIQEYIADFHGVGRLDGRDDAYQQALEELHDADLDYTVSYHSSPISDKIITFTKFISQWADRKPDDEKEIPFDFAGRVSYKRDNIGTIVRTARQNSRDGQ
jgi:hypothetical protein